MLRLPFHGRWAVQNSPARRVPSHGTELLGSSHAIDFVGVDERHRTAAVRDWRTVVATEPPERFVAFGRPLLAPCAGTVLAIHDGEPDHPARRSPLTLLGYALGQAGRVRQGIPAVAGNHVLLRGDDDAVVALVHLRRGSIRVAVGDEVAVGTPLAECGNSGNSTQPHVHVQATDSADLTVARALPLVFRDFREWRPGSPDPLLRDFGVPAEGAVVAPFEDGGAAR